MRILVLNHTPLEGSGTGTYAERLASLFQAKRHPSAVLTPVVRKEPERSFPYYQIGAEHSGARWELPFPFPSFSGHVDSPRLYTDLGRGEVATYLRVWNEALRDVCAEFRPDIVCVNHAFLLSYCAAKLGAAPYIIVSHGSEFLRIQEDGFEEYRREGLAGAACVVAISSQMAEILRKQTSLDDARLRTIPVGFDPEAFHVRSIDRRAALASVGLAESDFCVGCFGRLVDYKRPGDLLRAIADIAPPERPAALFVGGGPSLEKSRRMAEELGLSRIAFTGHIDDPARVSTLMNAVDLSLVLGEDDPYPLVGIESLACGTPLVCSDRCGLVELVDERVGRIVPVGQIGAIRQAVLAARTEDWKTRRGPAGPGRVASLTWNGIADRLLSLFRELGVATPAPRLGVTPS